jgi:hypothetical protein
MNITTWRYASRGGALLAGLFAAAALLAPRPAEAFERQWHLGVDLGGGVLLGTKAALGFGGGVHAAYGVNDMWNLVGALETYAYPGAQAVLAGGDVGVTYLVDVLQWVPYLGVTLGAYDLASYAPGCGAGTGAPCHALRLGGGVPFGLDYTVSRSLTVGGGGKFQVLYGPGATQLFLQHIEMFARVSYVFGY